MVALKEYPSAQEVRALLDYDPDTGVFTRRVRTSNDVRVGDIAGTVVRTTGYVHIRLGGRPLKAHRLAWLHVHGELPDRVYIDHINGDRSDNRIENLRLATRSQNMGNRRGSSNNKSGFKGVSFQKSVGKWRAGIAGNYLGLFATPEDAAAAYAAKAHELFGEFARAC